MINVTKSFLPPIEEYEEYLKKIWDKVYLTNQGPLLRELETKLKQFLNVEISTLLQMELLHYN